MREMKTQIKICGLTRPEEVRWVVEEGADYFGVVLFFPKSKRNCSIENARKLIETCHEECERKKRDGESFAVPLSVAVMVSPTPEQIEEIENAGFDMVQIHGELFDEVLEAVSLPVIRAVPISDMTDIADRENGGKYDNSPKIAAYLFDAQSPGSGRTFDWELLNTFLKNGVLPDGKELSVKKKIFLAGGLNSGNVRAAIQSVHPDVVDVSSGVEKTDVPNGCIVMKDREKIKDFIRKVRTDER